MKKGAHWNFAIGAILHRYATDCELPCHSVECVLLHYFEAQLYIFAVVNFADVALRTVARKFLIGGLCGSAGGGFVWAGGLDIIKLNILFIVFHVSILGGLELCLGG